MLLLRKPKVLMHHCFGPLLCFLSYVYHAVKLFALVGTQRYLRHFYPSPSYFVAVLGKFGIKTQHITFKIRWSECRCINCSLLCQLKSWRATHANDSTVHYLQHSCLQHLTQVLLVIICSVL